MYDSNNRKKCVFVLNYRGLNLHLERRFVQPMPLLFHPIDIRDENLGTLSFELWGKKKGNRWQLELKLA